MWQNALLYVANACLPLQESSHKGKKHDHYNYQDNYEDHKQENDHGQRQVIEGAWGGEDLWGAGKRRRVWFLACLAGYHDLAPQFDLVAKIVPGLLSIAILKGQMTAAEGRALMGKLKTNTKRHHRSVNLPPDLPAEQMLVGSTRMMGYENQGAQQMGYQGGTILDDPLDGVGAYGGSGLRIAPAFAVPELIETVPGSTPFVVDLNTASVNPTAASVDVLASTFHKLAMFDEFGDGEEAANQ